ncbi:MAG: isoprenylcysteine carboxylmethyltransferase family protein [Deltaproteobacteria bacterium]|nr:isoprenylcysteine carboxylmethyltransferase family protein [Deltaproteobacteria bacterium]
MPWMLVVFVVVVLAFHASEIAFVALVQRDRLSLESALLSPGYLAMLVLAIGEHLLEHAFFPAMKVAWISCVGLALVVAGELIRKTGMVTARRAFTHLIATTRSDDHALVTHGIYRFVRHPGYLGWLLWAIGCQLVLVNPITTVVAAIAAWRFFAARIPEEEAILVRFFPDSYEAYRRATPTWIPGIP